MESKIKHCDDVIWDIVDGVMTICNTRTSEFFELNKTGSTIWELVHESTESETLCHLQSTYPNEDIRRLEVDLHYFIQYLKQTGLIKSLLHQAKAKQ